MRHRYAPLAAGWLLAAACASAPSVPTPAAPVTAPPIWDDAALTTSLAVPPVSPLNSHALLVLTPQTSDALADSALAAHALLETTLSAHSDLDLVRLAGVARRLFADPPAFDAWRRGGPALPDGVAQLAARWVLIAHLRPGGTPAAGVEAAPTLHLRLVDRAEGRWYDHAVVLDAPRFWAARCGLLRLLTAADLVPAKQRGVMTWPEELSGGAWERLGALRGAALAAQLSGATACPECASGAAALLEQAPDSYLAHVVVGQQEARCDVAVGVFRRAVDLNPLGVDAHDGLGRCGDSKSKRLSYLIRRGRVDCGVAGKGLMGTLAARSTPDAGVVTGIGGFYVGQSCATEGVEVARFALDQARSPIQRANALRLLGLAQQGAGDVGAAVETLRTAATAAAEVEWSSLHGEILLRLGDALHQTSRHDDALVVLAEGLHVAGDDPQLSGRVLNSVGLVHPARGDSAAGLVAFEAARVRFDAIEDDTNLAVTLANIGNTYVLLAQYAEGVPYLERALALKRATGSEGGEIVLLADLGGALLAAGDPAGAAPHLAAAAERVTDPSTRAVVLNNLGQAHRAAGRDEAALAAFSEAVEAARNAGTRPIEGAALHNLGALAAARGDLPAADERYREALRVRRIAADVSGEGLTLHGLMDVAARRGLPRLAILYGKLAVQAHQRVRESARAVGGASHDAFLATRAATYRRLADLLIGEGRLYEAEAALRLLKGDELARWARRDREPREVPLTNAERAVEEQIRTLGDSVLAAAREYDELSRKASLGAAEQARLALLERQVIAANTHFNAYLSGLRAVLAKERPGASLRQELAVGPLLRKLGDDVVAVYTLLGADRYRAIVVTSKGRVAVEQPIDRAALNQLVADLRAALQDPQVDPRPLAKQLYDIVFAPIAKHVTAAGATTLMWSLDGVLRYIPVNALYDGDRWLVERYRSALFSPIVREWLAEPPRADWRVLAFGTSLAYPGFAALRGVSREVAAIVGAANPGAEPGLMPGEGHMDAGFTRATLLAGLRRRFPVVHIATHFQFQPGDERASFLLLGDGTHLPIAEIAALPNVFDELELLTLSACSTAVGDAAARDGGEVESFAVLAQEQGAHAVLASLWPIADDPTSLLMRLFYQARARDPGLTKLEALRRAQLWLLAGHREAPEGVVDAALPDVTRGAIGSGAGNAGASEALPGYRHPYYWAPFVLIGNWL